MALLQGPGVGRFLMSEVPLHRTVLEGSGARATKCEALGQLGQDEPASG